MSSLKNALQKAGFASTDQNKVVERQIKKAPQKGAGIEADAQSMRNQCELCNKFTSDVEHYQHNNRLVVKQWLCLKCADTHKISDDLRTSAQSTQARSGRFLREYGHTKSIKK
jgi:hypothetical protein